MTTRTLCIAMALAAGCASTRMKIDEDMSVEQHERAAADDGAEAKRHMARYEANAVRFVDLYPEEPYVCDRSLPGTCSPRWSVSKNPTEAELAEATAHAARARKHRAAARALRESEARACKDVAPWDRDMSPLLHRRDIELAEDLGASGGRGPQGAPAGAAVVFRSTTEMTAQTLQRIADCHLARNAALGWDQTENHQCPLNVKGAQARTRMDGERVVLEITSRDAGAALEIARRARVLVRPAVATGR